MSVNWLVAQATAIELLRGLVAVPSLSRQEAQASAWLVEQMQALGYARAFVDAAGNAVGEMGAIDAPHTVVLLGHIDTVPGNIPVRIEETADGAMLYGRGSVDAKGALATFVAGVAKLGSTWALAHEIRVVVVGAVEEESASSKGARFIRDSFDGIQAPVPDACIIGEPSSWQRVTLGYKGRILVELDASQPMAHTAGPDAGVALVAVDLWNWISAYAANFNQTRDKIFDQFQPSLRGLNTTTDAAMYDHVTAHVGIRLPLDFDVASFKAQMMAWAMQRVGLAATTYMPDRNLEPTSELLSFAGPLTTLTLRFRAHEQAWRSDRNNFLVRGFLAAIRQIEPSARPTFLSKSGTSDMNVVGPAWKCPILAYGPGDSALDHTPNEHVNLEDYWKAILVLEQALRNLPDLI